MNIAELLIISIILVSSCTKDRNISKEPVVLQDGQILILYWDFNNDDTSDDIIKPAITETDASIYFFQNSTKLPYCDGDNQSCWESVNDGTLENAQNNAEAGRALRLRNPSTNLDISASTEGFGEIKMSYAVKRTGSGAQKNIIQYTTDGVSYSSLGLSENEFTITEDYAILELDLTEIAGANNNVDFGVRIIFEDGNNNSSGNNRIDNLTFTGKSF